MRDIMLITALLVSACQAQSSSQDLPDISNVTLPDNPEAAKMTAKYLSIMDKKMALATEIGRIETRDQYVREVFIDMFSNPNLDPDVRAAFQKAGGEYVEAIDDLNTNELKLVMKGISWAELVDEENRLFERVFSIVQHTNDNAYREDTLVKIKPLAEAGLIEGQNYALMYDRVNLRKDSGQQLYGTQTKCVNGKYDVHDLSLPETVDVRRKAMGIEPLDIYLKRNREYYGPCQDK